LAEDGGYKFTQKEDMVVATLPLGRLAGAYWLTGRR